MIQGKKRGKRTANSNPFTMMALLEREVAQKGTRILMVNKPMEDVLEV